MFEFSLPILSRNQIDNKWKVTDWAMTIPEFRCFVDEDKSRDKKVAAAQLFYIAFVEDYVFWSGDETESFKLALLLSKVRDEKKNKDWKPNETIRTARKRYRELMLKYNPEISLMNASKITAETAIRILDDTLHSLKNYEFNGEDKDALDKLDIILKKTDRITERMKGLRKLLSDIEEIKEEQRKRYYEQKTRRLIGENTEVGPREDPKDSHYTQKHKAR